MIGNTLDLLRLAQTRINAYGNVRLRQGIGGHCEFYASASGVAIPIYHAQTGFRLEFLALDPWMTERQVGYHIDLMISLIRYKISHGLYDNRSNINFEDDISDFDPGIEVEIGPTLRRIRSTT